MARGIAKLGDLLDRVKNVSRNLTQNLTQNLTKEKVKNELAWMSGNAAICGAAKILTAATLATVTPAAIATAAGIVVGGILATSIRHIKEQVDVDVKKDGNTDSRLKLAVRHLNRVEIWDHMKTSQFRTRLLLNWGVSLGTFVLLEDTNIGQKVAEHAGKAIQKTAHWLSDRANAVFSMLKDAVKLDAKSVMSIPSALAMPAPAHVPNAVVVVDVPPTPSTPSATALPSKWGASEWIAEKHLKTPQHIKDYAYTLLNGKNGVTADPEAAIALYKEAARMGNLQARADLAYLASQKDYKGFGLTEYLKSHPTPVAHSPTTGTADAKHFAPKKPSHTYTDFKAQKPIEPAVKAPPNVSAKTAAPQTLENRAPAHITTCTNDVSPERVEGFLRGENDNIISVDCDPIKDASIQMAQNGDFIMLNGTRIEKDGPPELAKSWITRATATVSRMDWGWLEERFRSAAAKLATQKQVPSLLTASPSPALVALARVTPPESWLVHNIQ